MAKKKKNAPSLSEADELIMQQFLAALSPEERKEFDEASEMFSKMPKKLQDLLLDIVEVLGEMPDDEQKTLLQDFEKFEIGETDGRKQKANRDDESSSDEDDTDYTEEPYPHFLPRANVRKFTLRVTLRGLKPAIYRKFNVPSNITLRHLSELIIDLMGWTNEHLNQFRKGDNYYAPAYQRDGEDDFMWWGRARNYNQEDYTLSDILNEKGKTIEWEYDFGDSWRHDVRLSSIGDYEEGEPLVSFVKAERKCPPEDSGGIYGYEDLLMFYEKKKARKRLTKYEKELLEWYDMDDDFDPDYYDPDFAHEICEDYCE